MDDGGAVGQAAALRRDAFLAFAVAPALQGSYRDGGEADAAPDGCRCFEAAAWHGLQSETQPLVFGSLRDGVKVLAGKFEGDRCARVLAGFIVCFGSTDRAT